METLRLKTEKEPSRKMGSPSVNQINKNTVDSIIKQSHAAKGRRKTTQGMDKLKTIIHFRYTKKTPGHVQETTPKKASSQKKKKK